MLRLLIDENFDQRILRGLKLEIPSIDYLVVQETTLKGLRDPLLLDWAAENHKGRVEFSFACLCEILCVLCVKIFAFVISATEGHKCPL